MTLRRDQEFPPARPAKRRAIRKFETSGVETTTGPLGQGIATSVGMALRKKDARAEFGKKVVGHHTYVLASDGDLMEGISQERSRWLGLEAQQLIVLYDDNGTRSMRRPDLARDSVDQVKRFKSARLGRRADRRPGSQGDAARAIMRAQNIQQAAIIACKTTTATARRNKAGTAKPMGEALGATN